MIRPEIVRFIRKFKKLVTPGRGVAVNRYGSVRCRRRMCPIELVAYSVMRCKSAEGAFDEQAWKAAGIGKRAAMMIIDAADDNITRRQFSSWTDGGVRELRAIRKALLSAIGVPA